MESECIIFDGESHTCIEIPEKNVYVYGLSYEHKEIHEALYDGWKKSDKRGFHVLMAHGGDTEHIPMDFRKLQTVDLIILHLDISTSSRHRSRTGCCIPVRWSRSTGMTWESMDI